MIAKTLQSRPAVPTEADFAEYTKMSSEQVINDDGLGTATVGDALKDLDKKEKGPTDHDLKDAKTLTDDELDDKKQNDIKRGVFGINLKTAEVRQWDFPQESICQTEWRRRKRPARSSPFSGKVLCWWRLLHCQ